MRVAHTGARGCMMMAVLYTWINTDCSTSASDTISTLRGRDGSCIQSSSRSLSRRSSSMRRSLRDCLMRSNTYRFDTDKWVMNANRMPSALSLSEMMSSRGPSSNLHEGSSSQALISGSAAVRLKSR